MHRSGGVLVAAAVAAAAMSGLLVWRYQATYTDSGMAAYTSSFNHPETHAETLIVGMDGQAYGQIALDPTMRRAHAEFGSASAAAYRESRPVYGWVAFIASAGGDAAGVANAMLVLSVLSVALLAAAVGGFARRVGRPAAVGALVALLPGVAITVFAPGGAESLGCAAAFLGLAWWMDRRYAGAIVLFSFAALTRETLLLFPLSLAAYEIWSKRKTLVARLSIPCIVYVGWIGVVRWRVGALPSDATGGRLAFPLSGLLRAQAHWSQMSIAVALGIVGLAIFAASRLELGQIRVLLIAHLALAMVMGELVWLSWKDFSRVLLPIAILGIVALWPETGPSDLEDRTTVSLAGYVA